MQLLKKHLFFALLLILVLGAVFLTLRTSPSQYPKIGIITDLQGPAAYWGTSTLLGARLAQEDLRREGREIELVVDDYSLIPDRALVAAQRQVDVEHVDALFVEFNPAGYAVSPYLATQHALAIYNMAATSPIALSPTFFKTYLDYEAGCRDLAQAFRDDGVERIGVLKINLEAGDLCALGVAAVFDDEHRLVDEYAFGDTNVNVQLQKIAQSGATAVINVGFLQDTDAALRGIRDLDLPLRYGTVGDAVSDEMLATYAVELAGSYAFDFLGSRVPESDFLAQATRFNGGVAPASFTAAALAYIHVRQLAEVLTRCGRDTECAAGSLPLLPEQEQPLRFLGYRDDRSAVIAQEIYSPLER